ncbi:MAG: hypothetical protein HKO57_14905, partial [Akkermansiaceae bacterium]|nr:hypothetical protein [Akkermansiaceae bacterium]
PDEAPPVAAPPIPLRQATVHTPIYTYSRDYEQHLGVVPVVMTVQDDGEVSGLEMEFVPEFDSPVLEGMRLAVGASLQRTWPTLPRGKRVIFSTNQERYASRNGTALSGPMALLLHSAMTGKKLRPDLHFLGEVDVQGALVAPKRGWDLLRGLRRGPGGTLLVPAAFQPELEALLVLEEPEFFVKYEVLVVSSLAAALTLGSVDDSPAGQAEASALFETVRTAASKTPVGQLAVNKIFRARLDAIRTKAPHHLSANMLLLQGSSSRPTKLKSGILARDIRNTLDSIAWIERAEIRSLDPGKLEASWTTARRQLDTLRKFTERADAPLLDQAEAVVNTLRNMARSKRLDTKGKSEVHQRQIYDSHLALKDGLRRLRIRLAPLTGDPLPEGPAAEMPPPSDEPSDGEDARKE